VASTCASFISSNDGATEVALLPLPLSPTDGAFARDLFGLAPTATWAGTAVRAGLPATPDFGPGAYRSASASSRSLPRASSQPQRGLAALRSPRQRCAPRERVAEVARCHRRPMGSN
jgi:hypothetical protein